MSSITIPTSQEISLVSLLKQVPSKYFIVFTSVILHNKHIDTNIIAFDCFDDLAKHFVFEYIETVLLNNKIEIIVNGTVDHCYQFIATDTDPDHDNFGCSKIITSDLSETELQQLQEMVKEHISKNYRAPLPT